MERKEFLKNSIGLLSVASILEACAKSADATTTIAAGSGTVSGGCIVTPSETEGPYPYAGGEMNNPFNRIDVTSGRTGIPLALSFLVVNANNNCAVVPGARVDIWHCDKDGYYSGYSNTGYLGTQNNVGQAWLRGYQLTDANGKADFTTIFPGWYSGRATHIHMEVFINNVSKKTTQITFSESISDAVHQSTLYAAHGKNTTRNASDNIFNNSATDLANETVALAGNIKGEYSGSFTIGLAL